MELRSRKNLPASSVDYKERGESHDADDIEAIIDISDSGEEYGVPSSDSDDSSYRDESELFEEHTVMGSTSKANKKPAASDANDNDLGPNDYDYVSLSDDDAGPSSKRMKMDPWMSDYNESFQPANVEQQVEQNLNAAPRKTKNKKSRKKRGKGNSGSLLLWEVWEEENNIWIDQNLSVDCDLENQQGFSEEIAEPPSELIMPLLRYQKEWLAWALKQEDSVVKGGILADEMGMGKTIQAIALVLAKREIDAVTCVFSEPFTSEGSSTALAGIKTTLVVCPVVAVSQWVSEINRFTREGSTKVLVYHGPDRDRFSKQFAEYDFVITTYSIVEYEFRKFMMPPKTKCEYCGKLLNDDKLSVHLKYFCGPYATRTLKQSKQEKKKSKVKLVAPKEKKKVSRRKAKQQNLEDDMDENEDLQPENSSQEKKSNLHSVKWGRIILDEAHFIKDRRSNTAKAIFALESSYKWALSGTPLQNRVGELYSLVRFLQIVPYSYYLCKDCDCRTLDFRSSTKCSDCNHSSVRHFCWWNRYISNPIQAYGNGDAGRRAMILLKHKVLKNIVLRRTKKGRAADLALPPRVVTLRKDTLDVKEEDYYESLYNESQAQFNTYVDAGTVMNNYAHIFDLLTRLRQAVDHPYLVVHSQTAALRSRDAKGDNNVEHECGICHDPAEDPVVTSCAHAFCKACLLDFSASLGKVSCPTCSKMLTVDLTSSATGDQPARTTIKGFRSSSILNRIQLNDFQTSTKIEALREEIRLMVERDGSAKGIVFSQFTSFLDLINYSLQKSGVNCVQLVGSMTLPKRDAAIKKFTDDPDCKIFLMSLKAGGVALNLTVASHVFLMDPWWNPAVERQAQDRIHRLGQYKPIRIVRFVIENTVEERILQLQEKKELVFEGTVGGSTEALGKLTEADLRFLFIT